MLTSAVESVDNCPLAGDSGSVVVKLTVNSRRLGCGRAVDRHILHITDIPSFLGVIPRNSGHFRVRSPSYPQCAVS